MSAWRAILYLWAFPATLLGLPFVPWALLRGRAHVVDGVLEIHGPEIAFTLTRFTPLKGGASAITLGHIVLGRDLQLLELTRSHERIHVRQAERWGPLFIPAYLLCSLWIYLAGRNPYLDNPFEREAFDQGSISG
jgi:hypothetical protein